MRDIVIVIEEGSIFWLYVSSNQQLHGWKHKDPNDAGHEGHGGRLFADFLRQYFASA